MSESVIEGVTIPRHKINNKIRASEVRVIDASGENAGVMPTSQAIQLAKSANMDLVEVSGAAKPPVVRIMDYNKYLYEQKSKQRKTKTKKTDLKEFKLGPNIAEGDLKVRIERGKEFLAEGNMVKYTVTLKGRENLHPEFGEMKLKIIESELAGVATMEKGPEKQGNTISMTLVPGKTG